MVDTRRMKPTPFKIERNRGGDSVVLDMPLPKNDAELEILTEIYFGVKLHLSKLSAYPVEKRPDEPLLAHLSVHYQVKEQYSDYHGEGFDYSEYCGIGYNHSGLFWRTVLGVLSCGGIAGHSYGQTRSFGHRDKKRIENWICSRREEGPCKARKSFVRLAQKHGLGESATNLGTVAAAV